MHTHYEPSGKVDTNKAIALTLGALVIITILSFVYTAINAYNPIVYLSFLAVFGYGFALYYMLTYIMEEAKFRSKALGLGLLVLLGLWANYTQWVGFVDYISNGAELSIGSYFSSLADPGALFEMIPLINTMGTWGLGDSGTVSGGMLWGIWGIEFLMLLLVPLYFNWGTDIRPYSETQERFYDDLVVKEVFAPITSVPAAEKALQADTVGYLKSIDPTQTLPGSMVQLFTLPGENQSYLSMLKVTQDDKGNIQTTPLISNLRISNAAAQELKAHYAEVRDKAALDVKIED